jgi:UDP-2-acetamido-3-amino-2,3-dideoxy-glucuronate N-acetyltransferase
MERGAMTDPYVHISVQKDGLVQIGDDSRIWSYTQLGENVSIGKNTTIGRNVYLGPRVSIGNNCKIQNNALIYEPAIVSDGVFIGPGAILTNDKFPRAVNVDGTLKTTDDWMPVGVQIKFGASIGAGAICVAPVTIGEWSVVAAGSVVVKDVLPYALVAGVPARRIGWVGINGNPLKQIGDYLFECPATDFKYLETSDGTLKKI